MIRQTKNYLVGALSGVTVIGIAIGAFVVIVSAQVFHEFPIADTGGNAAKSSVAPAKVAGSHAASVPATTAAAGVNPALRGKVSKGRVATANGATRAGRRANTGNPSTSTDVSGPATTVEPTGGSGDEPSSSGGNAGSRSSRPSSSSGGGSQSSSTSGSSAGGNASSGASNSPATGSPGQGGNGAPAAPSGGTTIETPVTAVKVPGVAETVNEAVNGVDEAALGGTLEKTGVTEATEGVVNGAAGPETPVGKVVEGTAEAVGGLLGDKSSSGE